MPAQFSIVPQDRSARWILVPGVASTRQIEVRNDSDAPAECHLRVEEPAAASASPAVLTIQPHHSKTADIIVLANWMPGQDHRVVVSLRDPDGNQLGTLMHEIVAADSADCSLSLDLKEAIVADGVLAGFKLLCAIASRSATPRRFELNFTSHPALRYPDRKTVTLASGESGTFEVPVAWNRSLRDAQGWNHPSAVEVFVPVNGGRRTAALPWEMIEKRIEAHLSSDDREPKVLPAQPSTERPAGFIEKSPGQLKYTELLELKKLEQGVVAAAYPRPAVRPNGEAKPQESPARRRPVAPLAITGIALVATAVAAFFYLRPPVSPPQTAPVRVKASGLASSSSHGAKTNSSAMKHGPLATPAWTTVVTATQEAVNAPAPAKQVAAAPQAPQTVALAPKREPAQVPTIDRNAIVQLGGVDASYTAGGRAVNVVWSSSAQAGATVQLLDLNGKVIASRSVRGGRSDSSVRLPRGYHGSVSVEVTALGYHGERAVQGASLAPPG